MMKKLIAILVLMSLCPSLPAQEKDLSSFGVNTNPAGAIRPDTSVFCVGATWFIHLLR